MRKYDFNTPDDDLAFTIEMALSQLKLPPRKGKTETRDQHEQRRMFAARQIVQHIKRSNWKFEQGQVAREHSTDWRGKRND